MTGSAPAAAGARPWQDETIYQIYPRTFADSNGDGLGDLRGILGKADYLAALGVDAVWLTPVYRSSHFDNGYDVTDYLNIDPELGTLRDWEQLRDALHQRGIGLMMDVVFNHTSDRHPWFAQESRYKALQRRIDALPPASRAAARGLLDQPPRAAGPEHAALAQAIADLRAGSAEAAAAGYPTAEALCERLRARLHGPLPAAAADAAEDFYLWRAQPNNWRSYFQGSAWHAVPGTGKHYLALFSAHQPDLNWSNPRVRQALADILRVWADRGVDGFRLDAIDYVAKDMRFPDAPAAPGERLALAERSFTDLPQLHGYLREVLRDANRRGVRTVGELPSITPEQSLAYTGPQRQQLREAFLFDHVDSDFPHGNKYVATTFGLPAFRAAIDKQQAAVHGRGWIANFLENHDQQRAVSHFGDDGAYRVLSAKLLATLLFTLEGSPYVYAGQEIGMTNGQFNTLADIQDLEAVSYYKQAVSDGVPIATALAIARQRGRDNGRTAMQWDASPHAGFTRGTPRHPVNANYAEINVAQDLQDPRSVLHYYRRMIRLRTAQRVLVHGDYTDLLPNHPQVFAYARRLGEQTAHVLLNFSGASVAHNAPPAAQARLLVGNYADPPMAKDTLRPWEAVVYLQSGAAQQADAEQGAEMGTPAGARPPDHGG